MKQISLRLPDELHARLTTDAGTDRRSLHAQILWELEQTGKARHGTERHEPPNS